MNASKSKSHSWQRRLLYPSILALAAAGIGYFINSFINIKTTNRNVSLRELNCIRNDHNHYFKTATNSNNANNAMVPDILTEGSIVVDLEDFTKKLKSARKVDANNHGVMIHHGLSEDLTKYAPAIEFVALTASGESYWKMTPIPDMFFTVIDTELIPTTKASWIGDERYFANTYRKPNENSSRFDLIRRGIEIEAYLFGDNDQIDDLIDDNQDAKWIKFTSISEPSQHQGDIMVDLQHKVAAVMVYLDGQTPKEKIDDNPHGGKFSWRALDVGSPCPPRCGTEVAYLPDHGIPVRDDCK